MDKARNEVTKPIVLSESTSNQYSDVVQSTQIGSDLECYLVNLCTKPSNHEIRHYLKGKCKILADLGESQEVYGKEEFIPIETMISHEDMPNPQEVFWTDHGHILPVCLGKLEIIGLSGSTFQKIVDESVYWPLDKPIIYGKEFDLLTTIGRQKAEEQIKKH